jgi:multidrug transporter EmrE-like cation transporter
MSYQDLLPLVFSEIIGDFGFKKFANAGGVTNFATGIVGYIGVIYFLIRSLQGSTILLVNPAWDAMSALIEGLAAIIFLGETLDEPIKYVGIAFIITGLFCLKIPLNRKQKFVFPKFITEHFQIK